MGLSWHDEDYAKMVLELEEYFSTKDHFKFLTVADIHGIVGNLVNIMIDHGAVDPT